MWKEASIVTQARDEHSNHSGKARGSTFSDRVLCQLEPKQFADRLNGGYKREESMTPQDCGLKQS
jgi:hypothetical protein